MKYNGIPICYFPTTAVFVDDSNDFLMNLSLQFNDNLSYRLFESPTDALSILSQQDNYPRRFAQQCVSEYTNAVSAPNSSRTININVDAIHHEAYNPDRFAETSVLFVDYSMPGMNGLALCEALAHLPMQKVLLTGQADEKLAVRAFNEGLIHQFILKSDPDVITLMNQAVYDCQVRYFQEHAKTATPALAVDSSHFLNDSVCAAFFNDFCQRHQIIEYYLLESTGSFFLLDKAGVPSCLLIKSAEDLQPLIDIAADHGVDETLLMQLKAGSHIPYAPDSQGYSIIENIDWKNDMVPAKKLSGHSQDYYTSWVASSHLRGFDTANIRAYADYLDAMD